MALTDEEKCCSLLHLNFIFLAGGQAIPSHQFRSTRHSKWFLCQASIKIFKQCDGGSQRNALQSSMH
ncbi:conserved hypothetical protein [Ricinus communis]|uniref:Uncharacterized protein n=1 Tax=Ricinus communis TaxID=3988 RepID=B9RMW4_RICCO|nr:conserved hypothetical protein [Ricinus communis]